MLKKYELFEITTDDVTIRKLRRRGTDKLYLSTEELFDAIHTEHLSIGHGARDITNNKTSELYANVTKEMIHLYVDMCESCNLKKKQSKKITVS